MEKSIGKLLAYGKFQFLEIRKLDGPDGKGQFGNRNLD